VIASYVGYRWSCRYQIRGFLCGLCGTYTGNRNMAEMLSSTSHIPVTSIIVQVALHLIISALTKLLAMQLDEDLDLKSNYLR